MNFICPIVLLYAYYPNVISAFLYDPSLPFIERKSSLGNKEAEKPLFLTPIINAGKLNEARNRSRVVPLLDNIESYTGFLTVNKSAGSHLFFWYVPKTGIHNATAPLILWLNGGPGASSLFGLFHENGPLLVTQSYGLQKRDHAWTNHYHMLYIDQPVGTGFSFSESAEYIGTQTQVGEHLYEALVQFYKIFSELQNHDLYIAGQSYAGKYVPAIGYKIHTTSQRPHVPKIPLLSLIHISEPTRPY